MYVVLSLYNKKIMKNIRIEKVNYGSSKDESIKKYVNHKKFI